MRKINFKLTALHVLALATQILMEDMDAEMKLEGVSAEWRRETRFGLKEISDNIGKASRCFGKARTAYERFIEPSKDRCMRDKDGRFSPQMYTDNLKDANELLRLSLLYMEKCYQDFDNVNAVFRHLRSLKGCGVLEDTDIERYRIK